ncbi:MAG: PAS domain-containing protein [Deltaproteobacteria bacterium]|nr:PAS domain-containing protein [Deltaproteobacteria bacterium]
MFPPLRRRIFRGFFAVIAVNLILGSFLISAVFFASGLTPKLIRVNYDSISAANQMREAWWALHHPEDYSGIALQEREEDFEKSLEFEEGNITEPGEKFASIQIRKLWESFQQDPENVRQARFTEMLGYLDTLVQLNEKGMFSLASESRKVSRRIFFGAMAFIFGTIFLSALLSDRLANRLATPIKNVAEVLRSKPTLGSKLRLPEPTTLELSILNRELKELWVQLGDLDKLNLKQLVTQRNQLQSVLSSVEDGILVLNQEGRVVLCNEGMARIVGLEVEDLLQQSWRDLPTMSSNYIKLRGFLTPELKSNNSIELDIEGIKFVMAARFREIMGENEVSKIGSLFLLHDITQKMGKQRLKEEFISVLSHELKTPLQSLSTASEMLEKKKGSMDGSTAILVETIHEDVSRIRAIANDFMQVGQSELHSLKLHLRRLPLNRLLEDWVKPFKVLAKDREIEVEYIQEGSGEVWAMIDEVKFPWVVSNLLSNALRVSEPKHRVILRLRTRDGSILIEVEDQGPGISAEVEANMFEPFFQGGKQQGNPLAGFLGIGLTIAKELVEAHGGKIEYATETGKGSTFRILLPAA